MIRLKKRLKPLCYLYDGRLLAYRYSTFYILEAESLQIMQKYKVNLGFKESYLSRIRLIYRLLRLGVRNAFQITPDKALIFVNKRFYELNIQTMKIEPGFIPDKGVRALYISEIKDVTGFDDMIVFGGYVQNRHKKPVHIYKRNGLESWDVVYSFKSGEINHVHNMIPDKYNECVWILTGDTGHAAAIWKATNNFNTIECVLSNKQIYRGCVAFPVNGGLLYATDSPFSDNSIRFLQKENDSWTSKHLTDINGSCIYGAVFNNTFLFSTVVEGDGKKQNLLKFIFNRKKGSGIKDYYVYLYKGNLSLGFIEMYKVKKDIFPFIFQFGALKFPNGINNTDNILVEHIATNKYDCSTVIIK